MPKASRRTADPDAHLESDSRDAPDGADQAPRFNSPVRITFTHTRKRLADIDGISGKAALDALVASGILADDTAQQVAEVNHRQLKGEPEKTVIEIEELN